MFENIKNFFRKIGKKELEEAKSKETAKERLHLVLMQDRANMSADFLEMMKQEIIEVIKKYIDVDEKEIDVKLENKTAPDGTIGAPALYANIPILSIKNEARKLETRKESPNGGLEENKTEHENIGKETKSDSIEDEEEKEMKSDDIETIEKEEVENGNIGDIEKEEVENDDIGAIEKEEVENDDIGAIEKEEVENDDIGAIEEKEEKSNEVEAIEEQKTKNSDIEETKNNIKEMSNRNNNSKNMKSKKKERNKGKKK